MKIYYLSEKPGKEDTNYDTFDGFVVIARDGRQARRLVDRNPHQFERHETPKGGFHCERGRWLRPELTACREIGKARVDAEAGIVVASFNAG